MPESDRKSILPLWLIVLAMFGLYTIPKAVSPTPEPSASGKLSEDEKTPTPESKSTDAIGRARMSRLIGNYSDLGPALGYKSPTFARSPRQALWMIVTA